MRHSLIVLALAPASLAYAAAAQTPASVANWYRGYQFLAITDHNTFTDPAHFDSNPNDNFLLLGAEEVRNEKTVHVNAIGISRVIPPQRGSSVTEKR
jgi:hypothetical protein